MSNFLLLPCNLIIFTDNSSYDFIFKIRENNNYLDRTKIIVKDMTEFYSYKYIDYMRWCHTIDTEKSIHTPELYMIWCEKSFFLKEAKNINPFNSEWFFWTDIGSMRDKNMIKDVVNYPNIDKIKLLPTDKMTLITIVPYQERDFILDNNNIPIIYKNRSNNLSCADVIRIQAGFFGGYITVIDKWASKYEEILNLFISHNNFIGKEQFIMSTIYIQDPPSINLLQANNTDHDIWFDFYYRFS
jgi:hypothetical protein